MVKDVRAQQSPQIAQQIGIHFMVADPDTSKRVQAVLLVGTLCSVTLLMDAVLLAIVVYRGSVNWLSLWTIVVTGFGALLTLLLPRRLDVIMLGSLLIIVGAFPAFIGGLGLLFVPLAGGLLVAGMRSRWMAK